jgi:class 3 adenylate cyclase
MRDAVGAGGVKSSHEAASLVRFAGLILDLDACVLARDSGQAVRLTRGEFAVLRILVSRPGRVISRDALLDAFANRRLEPFDRSVDVLIGKLRRKIEPDPKQPRLIVTVPGEGYRFDGLRFAPPEIAKPVDAEGAAVRNATPMAAPPTERSAEAAPRAPERRHVTVLAAELVSPEGASFASDLEDLRAVIDAFRCAASGALARYGAAVGEARGREIVAYFGDRQAQENDAERAVRAALAIQRALAETNDRNPAKGAPGLSARIGIDSGSVIVEATGEVIGEPLHAAERVRAAAEPGSILVTMNIQRQVAGLFVAEERGPRDLGGVAEPVQLFRVMRASGGGRRVRARTLTPFVGREEELALLSRPGDRGVPRSASRNTPYLDRMERLAAPAEYAVASDRRMGPATIRRCRRARRQALRRARNRLAAGETRR